MMMFSKIMLATFLLMYYNISSHPYPGVSEAVVYKIKIEPIDHSPLAEPVVEIPQLYIPKTDSCENGQICVKYKLPQVTENGITRTGSIKISMEVLQEFADTKTISSPVLANYNSDSTYCFTININTIADDRLASGFDYRFRFDFVLEGYTIEPAYLGHFTGGQKVGYDYLFECRYPGKDYYSKALGDLHNLETWGSNEDGSGTPPDNFGTGKVFHLVNRYNAGYGFDMTGDWTVEGKISLGFWQQVNINGYTLSVAGLAGGGGFGGSPTSNLIITGNNGGDFGQVRISNDLKSFTLNRTGPGASATASPQVHDVLNIISGELRSQYAVLKSTAAGTARLAPVTGSIVGNVTVERFIPARRAWRLLTAPVTGGNCFIFNSWQLSRDSEISRGQGTHVTGGTRADGFDQDPRGHSGVSLKTYNSTTDTWQAVANTRNAAFGSNVYMIFVRGDRHIDLGMAAKATPTNTVLRAWGSPKVGDQNIPVNGNGFTAVANPYASPINFATITRNNVDNSFYVWDPKMGGTNGVGAYVNISFNGTGYDIIPTPVSPESQYIQSGQGFLVHASNSSGGSLIIKESDKSATPAQNVFRISGNSDKAALFAPAKNAQGLKITLQKPDSLGTAVLDEVFASYSSGFSNDIDGMDVPKITNIQENLAIIRKNHTLMVDRRSPIKNSDSVQLKLWNTTPAAYSFKFSPIDINNASSITLEDRFLRSTTTINPNEISELHFEVGADQASAATDRFRVIINHKRSSVPDGKATVSVYPNPLSNNSMNVHFQNVGAGNYQLQLLNSAGQTITRKRISVTGYNYNYQIPVTNNLPAGIYQLKITGKEQSFIVKILNP